MKSREKVLLGALVLLGFVECITHFGQVYPDSPGYMNLSKYLAGKEDLRSPARLLRPVVPALAALLEPLFGLGNAYGVVNLIMWISSSLIMFALCRDYLKYDFADAYTAAVLLTTSFPYLRWGGAVLTDMGAYFFILLSLYIWFHIDHEKGNCPIKRSEIALILVANLGVLTKENVVMVPLFLLLSALFLRRPLRKSIILAGLCLLLPIGWVILSGSDYLHWYLTGGVKYSMERGFPIGPRLLIVAFTYAFGWVGAILAIFGFLSEDSDPMIRWHMNVLAAGLLVVFAWPVADTRFMFILFPSIIPMSLAGLQWICRRLGKRPYLQTIPMWVWRVLSVALYVLANNYYTGILSFPWSPYVDPAVTALGTSQT